MIISFSILKHYIILIFWSSHCHFITITSKNCNNTTQMFSPQSSTVTVPVVSPSFTKGDYSEYGVQMALCEMLFQRRPCIHLLRYQATDYRQLPCEMLTVLRDNRYTEYPPPDVMGDEVIRRNFWDDVSRVIGHTSSQATPSLQLNGDL